MEGTATRSAQTNASSGNAVQTREGVAGCRFSESFERGAGGRTSAQGLTIAKLRHVPVQQEFRGNKDPRWTLPAG